MAMVFHSSSLVGPPNHMNFSSLHQFFSRKFRFHGNPGAQPSDPGKFLLSDRGFTSGISNSCLSVPKVSSASRLFNAVLNSQDLFVNKETRITGFPAMALVLANSMLVGLAMPLEALAETCEADNSMFTMPLLLLVALVGATVGGLVARQRKEELQRLNEQLRQINAALRRQAKIESYAPALSYAPVPVGGKVVETEVIVDPKKEELMSRLKTGKNYLRNLDPEKAFTEFKVALELAQELKDPIEEKKAARGLGASLQRQGKYREAISYHKMVLGISKRVRETSGNTEAYGAIADCYTELGDLENAGKFYDKYIARLEAD